VHRIISCSQATTDLSGEELAVVLPETSAEAAEEVAARILHVVRAVHLRQAPGAAISVSVGGATSDPRAEALPAADLVGRADAALYLAKQRGRDRFASG